MMKHVECIRGPLDGAEICVSVRSRFIFCASPVNSLETHRAFVASTDGREVPDAERKRLVGRYCIGLPHDGEAAWFAY